MIEFVVFVGESLNICSFSIVAFIFAEVDHCYSSPCLMGGVCINEKKGFKCNCPGNTVGEICQEGYMISIFKLLKKLNDTYL